MFVRLTGGFTNVTAEPPKKKKTKAGGNIFDRRKQTAVLSVYSPALDQDVHKMFWCRSYMQSSID